LGRSWGIRVGRKGVWQRTLTKWVGRTEKNIECVLLRGEPTMPGKRGGGGGGSEGMVKRPKESGKSFAVLLIGKGVGGDHNLEKGRG